jgi:hypothetical protein
MREEYIIGNNYFARRDLLNSFYIETIVNQIIERVIRELVIWIGNVKRKKNQQQT